MVPEPHVFEHDPYDPQLLQVQATANNAVVYSPLKSYIFSSPGQGFVLHEVEEDVGPEHLLPP